MQYDGIGADDGIGAEGHITEDFGAGKKDYPIHNLGVSIRLIRDFLFFIAAVLGPQGHAVVDRHTAADAGPVSDDDIVRMLEFEARPDFIDCIKIDSRNTGQAGQDEPGDEGKEKPPQAFSFAVHGNAVINNRTAGGLKQQLFTNRTYRLRFIRSGPQVRDKALPKSLYTGYRFHSCQQASIKAVFRFPVRRRYTAGRLFSLCP
jgi:hypothetical protein